MGEVTEAAEDGLFFSCSVRTTDVSSRRLCPSSPRVSATSSLLPQPWASRPHLRWGSVEMKIVKLEQRTPGPLMLQSKVHCPPILHSKCHWLGCWRHGPVGKVPIMQARHPEFESPASTEKLGAAAYICNASTGDGVKLRGSLGRPGQP